MRGISGTLLAALLLSAVINVRAAPTTITARTCSASDVQAALKRAGTGDTVIIPAGTCHWTTGFAWTAPSNVTLRGAGDLTRLGGGDATVLIDDYASGSPLLDIYANASGAFRLAGITIKGGGGRIKESGLISIRGLSKQMRVDHVHIDMQAYSNLTAGKPITFGQWLNGVVDHIVVDLAKQGHLLFSATHYGTGTENGGDQSFAGPTGFGTSDFVFVEDSQFNADKDPESKLSFGIVMDCNGGGRVVLRFNTVYAAGFQTHPTGGAGRGRGCRAHEIYKNNAFPSPNLNPLTDNPSFSFSWMSSGTSLVWGNSTLGTSKHFLYLDSMRKNNATYSQPAIPDGWGYCGRQFNGTGSVWDGNTDAQSGYPCLDQPGQGRSDLLSGQFPRTINTTTGTMAWPHQALEPVREWLNTFRAVRGWGNDISDRIGVAAGAEALLVENRDYYSYTNSFNGAGGIGAGLRASRPETCTPGVAYWSVDQGGNWDTSNSTANDGTLDVCSAENTWTDGFYTPYTYPHPLRGE